MTFALGAEELTPRSPSTLACDGRGCNRAPPASLRHRAQFFTEPLNLELVVHARRKTHLAAAPPGGVAGTAVVDDRGVRGIVTVRRQPAAAGSDIIVGVAMVDGVGRIDVPIEVLVEVVLPRGREHIRVVVAAQRIVVVLPARVARSLSGMRPTNADVILRR